VAAALAAVNARDHVALREPSPWCGVFRQGCLSNAKLKTGARIMATTKAREDIKNDLKTLKEDLKVGAREETARLREKAGAAEARIREKAAETGAQLRARSEELRGQARDYYEEARVRGREYYDDAAERLDEAQRYLTERVQERPVQSTAIALGVGLILGLLLAGRRR